MKNEREMERLNDGKVFSISYFIFMLLEENQKESNNFEETKQKNTNKFHASTFATCVPEILLYDGF